MNDRYNNPWFWIGIGGVILTAMGVSPETFTSWDVVMQQLLNLVQNPYMLVTTGLAVLGVFINPTTKGLKDK